MHVRRRAAPCGGAAPERPRLTAPRSATAPQVLPLIQMTRWSENEEIRRDAVQGLSSLAISDENRKVIVNFGAFDALFACFEAADAEAGAERRSAAASSSPSPAPGGGRGAPAGRDSKEEKPLQRLESIVSLKKAASKLHRKTRYYAIKRLAVEAIANLLEEPENQARFVELSGMSLFRNLIRTGEVFHQEQKRICAALNNLSKNEKMRRPLYERGLMLIVQDIVEQGNVDLVVSALRALRNCAVPVASDGGIPRPGARAPRQLIEWTSEDIRFISSLLLRSQDVRMSKLLLDIVRFIGGQEDHATDIIRFGGPQLLAKFFEASCSCTASASVRDSGRACIEALTRHDKSQSLLQAQDLSREGILSRMPDLLQSSLKKRGADPAHAQAADKLRSTTRCILDLCRGCTSAREWMSSQEFVVALLQLVRTRDIVAARCAAAILGELISKSTFPFVEPYIDELVESTIHMETDKMAQLSMIRVLETMCVEDRACVGICARHTEQLARLCERLCKHCISNNDSNVEMEDKRSIIRFVMNLSFDPGAQATLQAMLPILKHIQNLLQHSDAKLKEYTVIFIHNVYTSDNSKAIQLAAQSIWNIKHFARARTNTEAGAKAGEIANHYARDLAAQYIQRIYRSYRARKYMSKLGIMANYDERIKNVYAKMAVPRTPKASLNPFLFR